MHICYIDESGTSAIPGNTSHFVLAGLAIPIWHWQDCDGEIAAIKSRYGLSDAEIHTAWIARRYVEQSKIKNFESLGYSSRRSEVDRLRKAELLKLQRQPGKIALYKQVKKNYLKTDPYTHLTEKERKALLLGLATMVGNWGFARLFAECVDKIHFDPIRTRTNIDEQSFEQVVSRFEKYLELTEDGLGAKNYGILVHDNNETVAKKHTSLMKKFHQAGTVWTQVKNIIETPLFVDSQLTGMVQIADLCSFSLRRYLENNERELFDEVFKRADRVRDGTTVGVRHFTNMRCTCEICLNHRRV